jgi:hypothetical protein
MIGGGCSTLCSLAAILAFWHPTVASFLGKVLLVTTLYALVWDCITMEHDIRVNAPAPQLTAAQNRFAVWVTDRGRFFIAAPSLLLWICHRV